MEPLVTKREKGRGQCVVVCVCEERERGEGRCGGFWVATRYQAD